MTVQWNDNKRLQLIELKHKNLTWSAIAQEMSAVHDERYTTEQCRSQWRQHKDRLIDGKAIDEPDPKERYGAKIKKNEDGSLEVDQLIEISKEQLKDDSFILDAHGYASDNWDLVSHQFSMWNHHNKQDGTKTLYASKIKVQPKSKQGIDFDKLLETVKEVPTVNIKPIHTRKQSYLNVPLADLHFGVATYDDYKDTQARILELVKQGHEEILFIIGNDLLHHDNHKNQTNSGREIEHADMVQAWEYAKQFYYPLLEEALKNADKVKVMYTRGNHSETFEWSFVQMLKERYRQIDFDDEYKERKVTMLGLNYVGATHGDKKKMQNLSENFAVEFPAEWSIATTRTVFTGHLHHERVIDKGGLVLRQLPSGVKADGWHTDMGYTTAHKRFQVHQYSYDSEDCVYYV